MKLKQYIAENNITIADGARDLNVPGETFRLWVEEKRIPRKKNMQDITAWSNNAVQPNDFYDLSPSEPRVNGHAPQVGLMEAVA